MKQKNKSTNLSIKQTEVKLTSKTFEENIVFSFKYFGEKKHGFDCEPQEFKKLIKHLKGLSNLTWQQVQKTGRHELGSEIISQKQIKETIPDCYSKKNILAFRYAEKKPFLGVRENNTLQILYLDPKFDIYNH